MKNNLKRILSFVLVALMCVGMLPLSAFAADAVACPTCHGTNVTKQTTIEPTCTTKGGDLYSCSTCANDGNPNTDASFITNPVAELEHDFSDVEAVEVPSTCTVAGTSAVMGCTRCDATQGGTALALAPHTWKTIDGVAPDAEGWCVLQEAVCGVQGSIKKRDCEKCDTLDRTETTSGTEHDWELVSENKVSCEYFGTATKSTATFKCKSCNVENVVEVKVYDHRYIANADGSTKWFRTTEPTCTNEGVETAYCVNCDHTETRPVAALDHLNVTSKVTTDPTCTAEGVRTYTCERGCTWTEAVSKIAHDLEHFDEDPADCEGPGVAEHYKCKVCKKLFTDSFGVVETSADELAIIGKDPNGTDRADGAQHTWSAGTVIDATVCGGTKYTIYTCTKCNVAPVQYTETITHIVALDPTTEVPATCTTAGNSAYWHCANCDKYFSDAAGSVEIQKDSWNVAALNHQGYVTNAEVPATCTATGTKAHVYCGLCGKYFTDATFATETMAAELVIPMVPHVGDGIFEVQTAATCMVEGVEVDKCVNCANGIAATRAIPVDSNAHNFAAVGTLFSAEDCVNDVYAVYHHACTNTDGNGVACTVYDERTNDYFECHTDEYLKANVVMVPVAEKVPTCTTEGQGKYTCTKCQDYTLFVVIPALGHAKLFDVNNNMLPSNETNPYTSAETLAPTCTTVGTTTYYCNRAGCVGEGKHVIGSTEIPALNHDCDTTAATPDKTKAATCTDNAQNGYKCSRCEYVEWVEVAGTALSHDWDNGAITTPATCKDPGVKTYTCKNDSAHTKTEPVAIITTTHTGTLELVEAIADTCDTVGRKEHYKCSVCGKTYADADGNTPMADTTDDTYTAHNHVEVAKYNRAATCDVYGYTYYECSNGSCIDAYIVAIAPYNHYKLIHVAQQDATCTAAGIKAYYDCANCDKIFTDEKAENATTLGALAIAATGHKNAAGDVLTDDCLHVNAGVADRQCVNSCGQIIAVVHDFETINGAGTCVADAYTAVVCSKCFKVESHTITGGKDPNNHRYGAVQTVTNPTCTTAGATKKTCQDCGNVVNGTINPVNPNHGHKPTGGTGNAYWVLVQTVQPTNYSAGKYVYKCAYHASGCEETCEVTFGTPDTIKFVFSYINGNHANAAGEHVVNGGIVEVKIKVEALNQDVHNLRTRFAYDAAVLNYVGYTSANVFDHMEVSAVNGVITIYSYNDNKVNDNINGSMDYVTLKFRVDDLDETFVDNAPATYNTVFNNFVSTAYKYVAGNNNTAVEVNCEKYNAADVVETIEIHRLGDVRNFNIIDGEDHIALLDIYKAEGYMAEADVDMDGDVDSDDYVWLAYYLANQNTYAQFVAGPVVAEQ